MNLSRPAFVLRLLPGLLLLALVQAAAPAAGQPHQPASDDSDLALVRARLTELNARLVELIRRYEAREILTGELPARIGSLHDLKGSTMTGSTTSTVPGRRCYALPDRRPRSGNVARQLPRVLLPIPQGGRVNGSLLDASSVRALATGHLALRLDAANASEITLLAGREGGRVYADVASVSEAGLHFARKHLGLPKYEAFAIPVGAAMSQGLFEWLAGSWGPQPKAQDGAVLAVDGNFNLLGEAAFSAALVVSTRVPALDSASKEPGVLSVRFQPEFIEAKPASGKLSLGLAKQKLWRTSGFRLAIDGLDCTKVKRIDSFTVTREVTMVSDGSGVVSLIPGRVEFPNLTITLSSAATKTWFDWHQSFVIDGNNGDNFERHGTISFLANDLKTELSRIELHNLGIIRVAPEPGGSPSAVAAVAAELYCEEMRLTQG